MCTYSGLGRRKCDSNKVYFDRLFLRRFCHLLGYLFPGLLSQAFLAFLTLLALSGLEQVLVNKVGLVPSKFYPALIGIDMALFIKALQNACIYIGSMIVVKTLRQYASNFLYVSWRKTLCQSANIKYFDNNCYYKLNVIDAQIDNPDQRLTQDVDKLCLSFSTIFSILILSPFTIVYYTYRAYDRAGWVGPTACFGLFVAGAIINKVLMSPLVGIIFQQEKREGDYRFHHMHVRVNAESMALLGKSTVEYANSESRLAQLLATLKKLITHRLFLDFSMIFFDYLGSIASYLILALAIFSGKYDYMDKGERAQLVSETSFEYMYLIFCFTNLLDQSQKLTETAGTTHRVMELFERMNLIGLNADFGPAGGDGPLSHQRLTGYSQEDFSGCDVESKNAVRFDLREVTLGVPGDSNRVLFRSLDLAIKPGESLLVCGPSSSGKSALVRLLVGLWHEQEGSVKRRFGLGIPKSLVVLPQKPYFTFGSLRQQIMYPLKVEVIIDEDSQRITDYLHLAKLAFLIDRLGSLDEEVESNWYDILSPGEQQRLCFARLFFHAPVIAFLDEATSAMDADMETLLYNKCKEMGVTLVSIGHRPSLENFHDRKLTLNGDTTWSLDKL